MLQEMSMPAKAMLFGEFGALSGAPAVACTFFSHAFLVRCQLQAKCNLHSFTIRSSFYSNNKSSSSDPFFQNLLFPWQNEIYNQHLLIDVEKSFPSHLGFGSSSALIASISLLLWRTFFPQDDPLSSALFWEKVYQSLKLTQGSASGYDVAVQLHASQHRNESGFALWQFRKSSPKPLVKQLLISNSEVKKYGCFVKTNLYSCTKKVVTSFLKDEQKSFWATQHAAIAQRFLENPCSENLHSLFALSKDLALKQGLFPLENAEFKSLFSTLEAQHISFKSMGSGHGDCLWVLANRQTLIEKCGISVHDIPFAFEDIINHV